MIRPHSAGYIPAWVRGTIPGQLVSMKNGRKIVMFGKRPGSIKSDKARAWEKIAIAAIREATGDGWITIQGPVCLTVRAYYANARSDLDTALLHDCLQAAGAIQNDKQIVEEHAYRLTDKDNPRVEFELRALKP